MDNHNKMSMEVERVEFLKCVGSLKHGVIIFRNNVYTRALQKKSSFGFRTYYKCHDHMKGCRARLHCNADIVISYKQIHNHEDNIKKVVHYRFVDKLKGRLEKDLQTGVGQIYREEFTIAEITLPPEQAVLLPTYDNLRTFLYRTRDYFKKQQNKQNILCGVENEVDNEDATLKSNEECIDDPPEPSDDSNHSVEMMEESIDDDGTVSNENDETQVMEGSATQTDSNENDEPEVVEETSKNPLISAKDKSNSILQNGGNVNNIQPPVYNSGQPSNAMKSILKMVDDMRNQAPGPSVEAAASPVQLQSSVAPQETPAASNFPELRSFCDFVSAKMKSYNSKTIKAVQHNIFQILFKADSGDCEYNTSHLMPSERVSQMMPSGNMLQVMPYNNMPQVMPYNNMPQVMPYNNMPQVMPYNMPQQALCVTNMPQAMYGNMPQQAMCVTNMPQTMYGSMAQQAMHVPGVSQAMYGSMPQQSSHGVSIPQQATRSVNMPEVEPSGRTSPSGKKSRQINSTRKPKVSSGNFPQKISHVKDPITALPHDNVPRNNSFVKASQSVRPQLPSRQSAAIPTNIENPAVSFEGCLKSITSNSPTESDTCSESFPMIDPISVNSIPLQKFSEQSNS